MPFLRSPAFDLGWFVLPGLLAALLGVVLGVTSPEPPTHDSLLLWIVGVLLVDVAHVYASLYRTYRDPLARVVLSHLHLDIRNAHPEVVPERVLALP